MIQIKPTQKRLYDQLILTCMYKDQEFVSNGIFAIRKELAQVDAKYQLKLNAWNEQKAKKPELDGIINLAEFNNQVTNNNMVDLVEETQTFSTEGGNTIKLNPYYVNYLTKCLANINYKMFTDCDKETIVYISQGELIAVIKAIKSN